MAKAQILSKYHINKFNAPPKLTKNEKDVYFEIDLKTKKAIKGMKKVNKVGFVIQLAYFRAKARFFPVSTFRASDINQVKHALNIKEKIDIGEYNSSISYDHRLKILAILGWKQKDDNFEKRLSVETGYLIKQNASSEDVLYKLLDFFWRNRVEIPPYNFFNEIIHETIKRREQENIDIIKNQITNEQIMLLTAIVDENRRDFSFLQLKRTNQSLGEKVLRLNAEILAFYKEIFIGCKDLIDQLALTKDQIIELSSWLHKSNTYQLKKKSKINEQYLILVAFVIEQFYKRQDDAALAFLKKMRFAHNSALGHQNRTAESFDIDLANKNSQALTTAMTNIAIIKLINEYIENYDLGDQEKIFKIKSLIDSHFSNNKNQEEELNNAINLNNIKKDKRHYYKYLETHSVSLQRALSPLLYQFIFDEKNSDKNVIEAINYFIKHNGKLKKDAPTKFLSKKDKRFIYESEKFDIKRYKVILFHYIAEAFRSRKITLKYSFKYMAITNWLINDDVWNKKRNELLRSAGLTKFININTIIEKIGKESDQAFIKLNKDIISGKNSFVYLNKSGRLSKKNEPATDYSIEKYISSLLDKQTPNGVQIYSIIKEIDRFTNFSDDFKHFQERNTSKLINTKLVYATLMSLGFNYGHKSFIRASKGIELDQLRDTENFWFSTNNIEKANNKIVSVIQQLNLPDIYQSVNNEIHTSSDGRKVTVAIDSLIANKAFKYFGNEQGVNINSFVDEKNSFFYTNVLSSSEREAAYMLEGMLISNFSQYHESTDKAEHLHSTDSHGYTEAIFTGLYFMDIKFSPRIQNCQKQVLHGYSKKFFKENKLKFKPKTFIDIKIIIDNWDDILRFMTSIKLGYAPPALAFRSLSATEKNSPLYQALKAFGKLLKTRFLLSYFNDKTLRERVQKQLNKVELGQRLSKAIFSERDSKFYVGEAEEMKKQAAATNLIKNIIILWNYLFITDYLINIKDKDERSQVVEKIAEGSVIAHAHINLKGQFDFTSKETRLIKTTKTKLMNFKAV